MNTIINSFTSQQNRSCFVNFSCLNNFLHILLTELCVMELKILLIECFNSYYWLLANGCFDSFNFFPSQVDCL